MSPRIPRRLFRAPLAAAAILLAIAMVVGAWRARAGAVGAPASQGRLRVDFVAVGHGDAILITSPIGKTVLVDGGLAEAGDTVAAFVRSRTAAPLDLVMLTHRHADHLGGLAKVIDRQGTHAFMDAAFAHPSPAYEALMRVLDRRHVAIVEARRGRIVDLGGGARLVLLTPPEPLILGSRSDPNSNSLVVRLEYGGVRMLLTGDAEAVTEEWLLAQHADLRADVLKLAHHGSRYSSTAAFIKAVSPRVAVVSCAPAEAPGHAHPGTLARVRDLGARLYRTDVDGNITVSTDGHDIRVDAQNGPSAHIAQGIR